MTDMSDAASELAPAIVVPVSRAELERTRLDSEHVVSGVAIEGHRLLATSGDVEVGIWELSVATVRDVEADELFVVTAGRATVEIAADDAHPAATLELEPGSIARLSAGMSTVWTIHETFRKVYVSL